MFGDRLANDGVVPSERVTVLARRPTFEQAGAPHVREQKRDGARREGGDGRNTAHNRLCMVNGLLASVPTPFDAQPRARGGVYGLFDLEDVVLDIAVCLAVDSKRSFLAGGASERQKTLRSRHRTSISGSAHRACLELLSPAGEVPPGSPESPDPGGMMRISRNRGMVPPDPAVNARFPGGPTEAHDCTYSHEYVNSTRLELADVGQSMAMAMAMDYIDLRKRGRWSLMLSVQPGVSR